MKEEEVIASNEVDDYINKRFPNVCLGFCSFEPAYIVFRLDKVAYKLFGQEMRGELDNE